MRILLIIASLVISLAAAAGDKVAWKAGRIWTGNPDMPWASVIIVDDNRITAVGGDDLLSGFDGLVRETGGALVVPGMIDNHTHFLTGVEGLVFVPTFGATSKEDFVARIAAYMDGLEPGTWITGGIWDETVWGGELPTREWVDSVTGDHPLFLSRLDGHSALVNSKALELAGITADTPDPVGGEIIRDESGNPTGILVDAAMTPVFDVLPERTEEGEDRLLDIGMAHALSKGLTQVHSIANVLEDTGWREFTVFRRARAAGRQKIRALIYVPLADRHELAEVIAREGKGDAWLSWPGVKHMTDGSLGSRSAWMMEPYSDDPSNTGFPIQPVEDLEKEIVEAHELGLQLAIHAIGDQSNKALLDIFERNAIGGSRPRVEHAQHLRQEDIARFGALGVIPAAHPYHAIDDGRWAEDRIGKDRLAGTYAFRALLDSGARLSFGSDWNVAPLNPLDGIYAAVTRQTLDGKNPDGWVPEQKISVEEALTAYTVGGAWAAGMDKDIGSIEPGKLADFVVLDRDLFRIAPETIRDTKVLTTVIDGKVMYRAGE